MTCLMGRNVVSFIFLTLTLCLLTSFLFSWSLTRILLPFLVRYEKEISWQVYKDMKMKKKPSKTKEDTKESAKKLRNIIEYFGCKTGYLLWIQETPFRRWDWNAWIGMELQSSYHHQSMRRRKSRVQHMTWQAVGLTRISQDAKIDSNTWER